MNNPSRFVSAFLFTALFSFAAHSQIRQTHLYIDDGHGSFTVLSAPLGGGALTFPSSGTLATMSNSVAFDVASTPSPVVQTSTTAANYLFNLYSHLSVTGNALGGLISAQTDGTHGGNATGLTINTQSDHAGVATGLSVSAAGGGTNYAIAATGDISTSTRVLIAGNAILQCPSATNAYDVSIMLGGSSEPSNISSTAIDCAYFGAGTAFHNSAPGNTFLGWRSGYWNFTGFDNTYVGAAAGYALQGGFNTAVGADIGTNGATSFNYSILLGYDAQGSGNNQFIVGGMNTGEGVTDAYFGNGVQPAASNNPVSITLHATGGIGTDKTGADISIAGGEGTGAGAGGTIHFETAPAGATGASLNGLVDAMIIQSGGDVHVGNSTGTSLFSVGTSAALTVNASGNLSTNGTLQVGSSSSTISGIFTGTGSIAAAGTTVAVANTNVTGTSKVIVTATNGSDTPGVVVKSISSGTGFTVSTSTGTSTTAGVSFNYIIIN